MTQEKRLRVVLLFGGRSAEHEVSCTSAVAVARALDPKRYEVIPVAITRDGRWQLAGEAHAAIEAGRWPSAFPTRGDPVRISDSAPARLEGTSTGGPIDVVFPLLHGPYGEDGTVQGLLELAGIPYVGSGVLGSAVGMDKVMMKRAFVACGLPTPAHVALRAGTFTAADVDGAVEQLGFPCFVKPANLGSSVGVSKVHSRSRLEEAVDVALGFDEWILIEEAIAGREIEVAVLGDLEPQASLPGEIIPGAEFYSYEDKYIDDRAGLVAPADLEPQATEAVRRLAVAAFQACRCEGMARVDFFYEPQGRGWLVNEVNTIPGFTAISMYPKLWEVSGLSYPDLIDRLVELALERHRRREERAGRQRQ
jgi:D-alanine-D-alanine ligase